MKKAQTIISHLKSTPHLKNLQKSQCYKKLLSCLPDSLQKGVYFVYNKNDTLFFALKHPVFKEEFYHKTLTIKNLLETLVKYEPDCSCIKAKNVKFFVTKKNLEEAEEHKGTLPIYKERSDGTFKNPFSNKKIYKLFEEIRECIKNLKKP